MNTLSVVLDVDAVGDDWKHLPKKDQVVSPRALKVVCFTTVQAAEEEALRLAAENPGGRYCVLTSHAVAYDNSGWSPPSEQRPERINGNERLYVDALEVSALLPRFF